jgi:ribosome-associated protein
LGAVKAPVEQADGDRQEERAGADAAPDNFIPEAAYCAARAAADKLGEDTVILVMGALLGVTDAFVITSGRNSRQVRTIVDEVKRQVKADLERVPWSVEGTRDMRWVLMDYGDFLVHVFHEEDRNFYDLERLWGDAPRVRPDADGPPRAVDD